MEFFGVNGDFLQFGLIQAQDRGVLFFEEALDGAFVDASIEAIYVPAPDIAGAIWELFEGRVSSFNERGPDTTESLFVGLVFFGRQRIFHNYFSSRLGRVLFGFFQ